MWIVDSRLKALEEQGRPIRIGIVGAGFMCQGLTNHIAHSVPGMRVVAISNRKVERATKVFSYAGYDDVVVADSQRKFEDAASCLRPVVTADAMLLARSAYIDVLVDVTGSVEFGAHVAGRWWKSARWPNAISRSARCSTTMACT
jgi:predicted homoserine dehydrogenase-like protein